jgi:hypothetical protein
MKKLLVSLGVIGMLVATPAFAATKHKPVTHNHTHHAVCMHKGKRVTCPDTMMIKKHHKKY